jgi:hypothetical protein
MTDADVDRVAAEIQRLLGADVGEARAERATA